LEPKKEKQCKCGTNFRQFNSLDKYCSYDCKKRFSSPPNLKLKSLYQIPKVSKKRIVDNAKYSVLRIEFLGKPENRICFISGCGKVADTIEHTKKRLGYADEWARENNISLYLDVRFWKPCCLKHNLELENNPELSKKYQLSKLHNGKKL